MSDAKPPAKPAPESREAKLAKALRDNLRRRKAAGRVEAAPNQQEPPSDDP
jgi:hypothetical protein